MRHNGRAHDREPHVVPVSARFLLEGFWHSVEQCGRLLHSAVTVYNAGDYSTGAGLALLAREELGKGRILRGMWEQEQAGKVIEIADVRAALEDHEDKQAAAQLSNTLTASYGTYAGKLMQRMMADPTSEDGKAATAELDALMAKKAKRTPSDRHEARQRSF
jgi:AbiV family abortive infection protein